MAITLDGTNGITAPDVDSTTSVTTPLVTSSGALALSTTSANAITASTDGQERMRIDASGNVGIGTSSPLAKLQVVSGSSLGGILIGLSGTSLNAYDANEHRFRSGASGELARIDSSGNLLVGTTSPAGGSPADPVGISFFGSGSGVSQGAGVFVRDSPNAVLFVNNKRTGGQLVAFQNGGNSVGSITSNGTTTSYNTSSDYRLKENVVLLTGAADRLSQIPVHRFNFIADPDTTLDGFLAHEVQAFVPECVTGQKDEVDDEGKPVYQAIDQSKLVPLLTAALQEALQTIQALEARVASLETPA